MVQSTLRKPQYARSPSGPAHQKPFNNEETYEVHRLCCIWRSDQQLWKGALV